MKEKLESETETETDSGSGSESDSEEPDPNASGPLDGPKISNGGAGKLTPKAMVSDPFTLVRASGAKRPAEEKDIEAQDVKKSKAKRPKARVSDPVTLVRASGAKRPTEEKDIEAKDAKKSKAKHFSDPVTLVRASGAKRPVEEKDIEAKDVKKSKAKPPEHELETSVKRSNGDSKKQLFQRLWSEDDEIAMLEGMIDYAERKKSDPVADLNAFHDFIRDNLHVDVTRSQLQDKISRLKKKYENNKGKEKEGKERIFSKPHEQKAYELSKQIWGCENGKGIANGGLDRVWSSMAMKSNEVSMYERVCRIGSEMFGRNDGVEGSREWRMLMVQYIESHVKILELKLARAKLVLDVVKSLNE